MTPSRFAVDRAIELHGLTGGLFDPTVHDRLVELGYDRTFAKIAAVDRPASSPALRTPVLAGIERDGHHIRLPAGVRLDLGGIGKGLAADLARRRTHRRGARSACVSLGGDIRVAGSTPDGPGGTIPVEDPLDRTWSPGSFPLAERRHRHQYDADPHMATGRRCSTI